MDKSLVSRQRYEREKTAREAAEKLLETKSKELFHANQKLDDYARNLEALVNQKTSELQEVLQVERKALEKLRITESKLFASEKRFRSFVENANDIIFTLTIEGHFNYLSPGVTDILGYDETNLLGRHFASMIHPNDLAIFVDFFERLLENSKRDSGLEYRVRHADGSWRWHNTNASPMFDENDNFCGMLGIGRDIQERKRDQAKLYRLANFDTLTGLANRASILALLERELEYAQSSKSSLAVLFLDLNKFKIINDTYGHQVGDQVLQRTAKRLKSAVREYTDAVGRLAGDEFLIVLPSIKGNETAHQVAKRIKSCFSSPLQFPEMQITVGCSVGVSIYPEDAHDVNALVSHADTAMYKHKASKLGDAHFSSCY